MLQLSQFELEPLIIRDLGIIVIITSTMILKLSLEIGEWNDYIFQLI